MKQVALLLYGSLTFGLAVTLFGIFQPPSPYDSYGLGIPFNGVCGDYEKRPLIESKPDYKIEIKGISCNNGVPIYIFTSPNRDYNVTNEATE